MQFPRSPFFGFPVADKALLRFTISGSTLSQLLIPYILDRGTFYGTSSFVNQMHDVNASPKKVLIEFSSPNLTKEFDGDYLRSTLVGQSIASLHKGYNVSRTNFVGDWGPHMGLLAVGWRRFGSEELLEADPLQHILHIFSKIDMLRSEEEQDRHDRPDEHGESVVNGSLTISQERDECFHRMETRNTAALNIWRRLRDTTLSAYKNLYKSLNIVFDEYCGESDVSQESIAEVETKLDDGGFSEELEGVRVVDFRKHGFKTLGKGTLRSHGGNSSYLLRHVAAALDHNLKGAFDNMVYVTSAKQDLHFQQLFKILELVGHSDVASKLRHVNFGKVDGLLPADGSPGLVLPDIITSCQQSVVGNLRTQEDSIIHSIGTDPKPEHLKDLGTLNLATQVLSTKRSAPQTLHIQELPNTEEYTGMTLQHCLDELQSKLGEDYTRSEEQETIDFTSMSGVEEYTDTMRLLAQFPGIVQSAFDSLEPSIILDYLFRLSDQLISVFEVEVGDHDGLPDQKARMSFYACSRTVMENGMDLLGLVPLRL